MATMLRRGVGGRVAGIRCIPLQDPRTRRTTSRLQGRSTPDGPWRGVPSPCSLLPRVPSHRGDRVQGAARLPGGKGIARDQSRPWARAFSTTTTTTTPAPSPTNNGGSNHSNHEDTGSSRLGRGLLAVGFLSTAALGALLHVDQVQRWWISNVPGGQDILVWLLRTEEALLATAQAQGREAQAWLSSHLARLLQTGKAHLLEFQARVMQGLQELAQPMREGVSQTIRHTTEALDTWTRGMVDTLSRTLGSLGSPLDGVRELLAQAWAGIRRIAGMADGTPTPVASSKAASAPSPASAKAEAPKVEPFPPAPAEKAPAVPAVVSAVATPASPPSESPVALVPAPAPVTPKESPNPAPTSTPAPSSADAKVSKQRAEEMDFLATELFLSGAESIISHEKDAPGPVADDSVPVPVPVVVLTEVEESSTSANVVPEEVAVVAKAVDAEPIPAPASPKPPPAAVIALSEESTPMQVESQPTESVSAKLMGMSFDASSLMADAPCRRPLQHLTPEPTRVHTRALFLGHTAEAGPPVHPPVSPSLYLISACIRRLEEHLLKSQEAAEALPQELASQVTQDLELLSGATEHLVQELEMAAQQSLEAVEAEHHGLLQAAMSEAQEALLQQARDMEALFLGALDQTRQQDAAEFDLTAACLVNELLCQFEEERAALQRKVEETQAYWTQHVAERIDQERSGRLARLGEISERLDHVTVVGQEREGLLSAYKHMHHLHLAIAGLRDALNRPRHPCAQEVEVVGKLAAQAPSPTDQAAYATILATIPSDVRRDGILALEDLISLYEERVRPEVRRVAYLPEGRAATPLTYALSVLASWVIPPPGSLLGPAWDRLWGKEMPTSPLPGGEDVAGVLARADYYLQHRNLDAAARELNQLRGWPRVLAADWLREARRRLELSQALQVLELMAQVPPSASPAVPA